MRYRRYLVEQRASFISLFYFYLLSVDTIDRSCQEHTYYWQEVLQDQKDHRNTSLQHIKHQELNLTTLFQLQCSNYSFIEHYVAEEAPAYALSHNKLRYNCNLISKMILPPLVYFILRFYWWAVIKVPMCSAFFLQNYRKYLKQLLTMNQCRFR